MPEDLPNKYDDNKMEKRIAPLLRWALLTDTSKEFHDSILALGLYNFKDSGNLVKIAEDMWKTKDNLSQKQELPSLLYPFS